MQAHPRATKEERRSLCRLIDARKLSAEAAAHAVQNDRLPVRCLVQVLFLSSSSEQHGGGKLIAGHHRLAEWTGGSFRDPQQIISRSPAAAAAASLDLPAYSNAVSAGGSARCPSKREVAVAAAAQHHELRRLREDVARLQVYSVPLALLPFCACVHAMTMSQTTGTCGDDDALHPPTHAGAVPGAAGAGGPAGLGERPAGAGAGAVQVGRRVPVRRRRTGHGRRRDVEGGRLRQRRRGQDAAQRREAAGPRHADGVDKVAQVSLVKPANIVDVYPSFFFKQLKVYCSFYCWFAHVFLEIVHDPHDDHELTSLCPLPCA